MSPKYWNKALKHLSERDKVMAELAKKYSGREERLVRKNNPFHTLLRSVCGQQISVKAADAIWLRLENACDGKLSAQAVLALSEPELRACGLSRQKILYMKNVAEFFVSNNIDDEYFYNITPEEAMALLLPIKGIGEWTVEMFQIFHMHAPDIFPIKDIGVLKAIYKLYYNGEKVANAELLRLAESWRPYRTVATWLLWRHLDPIPVEY
jgi:DNA-3-methyladenine glycosylase II